MAQRDRYTDRREDGGRHRHTLTSSPYALVDDRARNERDSHGSRKYDSSHSRKHARDDVEGDEVDYRRRRRDADNARPDDSPSRNDDKRRPVESEHDRSARGHDVHAPLNDERGHSVRRRRRESDAEGDDKDGRRSGVRRRAEDERYDNTRPASRFDESRTVTRGTVVRVAALHGGGIGAGGGVRERDRDGGRANDGSAVGGTTVGIGDEVPQWELYVSELDRLFFKPTDHIRKGSDEYDEMWAFLRRYEEFRRNRPPLPPPSARHSQNDERQQQPALPPDSPFADLPSRYDSRYRMNFSLLADAIPGAHGVDNRTNRRGRGASRYFGGSMHRGGGDAHDNDDDGIDHDRSGGRRLGKKEIAEFLDRMRHFENFLQREKLSKLVKMRRDKANLPIAKYKDAIVRLVRENRVVVVSGDTGCGKSTQVPQYLVEGGFRAVACTQPRRIACVSLARRVGHEMMSPPGVLAAHHIRFEDTKSTHTRVTFVTEGLLLRQLASTGGALEDGSARYDVIVADEMHERSMQGDFLLAVLANKLMRERSDVRLVIMSATINVELFSRYFNGAPIVQVPGRLYPIDVHYHPVHDASAKEDLGKGGERKPLKPERINPLPFVRIMERIDREYPSTERGDLLIFLSGTAEIAAVELAAKEYASQTKRWIVLPLHSALSSKAQDKCFDTPPPGVRKCVISTNIAETSVTIDGIRFVVDSGRVKEMGYDPQARMRRLCEYWVSRASAEQRKGRAGRTGPGVCYRMYSQDDFSAFAAYPVPELRRVPMDAVILQLLDMGVGNPRSFVFVEAPPEGAIDRSLETLLMHGAITARSIASATLSATLASSAAVGAAASADVDVRGEGGDAQDGHVRASAGSVGSAAAAIASPRLTSLGKLLARLPVDTVVGKMLVLGAVAGVAGDAMVLAAGLTVQSPLLKADGRSQEKREELVSAEGDALTVMNAYTGWAREPRGNRRRWCRERGLEEQRLIEMSRLVEQFREILVTHGILRPPSGDRDGNPGTLGGSDDFVAFDDPAELERERRRRRRRERRRDALDRLRTTNKRRGVLAVGDDGGNVEAGTSDEEEEEKKQEERRRKGRDRDKRRRYGPGTDGESGDVGEAHNSDDDARFELDNADDAFDGGGSGDGCRSGGDSDGDKGEGEGEGEGRGDKKGGGGGSNDRMRVLKAVMSMALYPQLALPDEHNAAKRDSEKIYHAHSKQFVAMHPSSVYYADPSLLGPGDLGSARDGHHVLCYVSLLETAKPYLVGVSRTPLAPSLFMLCSIVDTVEDCRRIVFDRWIEVVFSSAEQAQSILAAAIRVRIMWRHLVSRRLARTAMGAFRVSGDNSNIANNNNNNNSTGAIVNGEDASGEGTAILGANGDTTTGDVAVDGLAGGEAIVAPPYVAEALADAADFVAMKCIGGETNDELEVRMIRQLARSIAALVKSRVQCSAARVSALQSERLGIAEGMSVDAAYPNPIAGFLRWGSLSLANAAPASGGEGGGADKTTAPSSGVPVSEHLRTVWRCPVCGRNLIVNGVERESHRLKCAPPPAGVESGQSTGDGAVTQAQSQAARGGRPAAEPHFLREYECSVCGETLMLTNTMILRHVRMHREETE